MYIDLVICKHDGSNKPFLFQAPAWSRLSNGDSVIVDTCHGKQTATVQAVCTVERGSQEYVCMMMAAKATHPLRKVLSRVYYADFSYPEEETT